MEVLFQVLLFLLLVIKCRVFVGIQLGGRTYPTPLLSSWMN